jgi:hypothetical protein
VFWGLSVEVDTWLRYRGLSALNGRVGHVVQGEDHAM